ncbi:MAG: LUD domain-containing protein, partial [Bacteroidia bacterium]|nr:LUD domain-containing protein [Bacteroidia bacterium]
MLSNPNKKPLDYSNIRSGGEEANTREKILKKIRKALISRGDTSYLKTDVESEIFSKKEDAPEITFAEKFSELHGNFIFCLDENELAENLNNLFTEKKWTEAFSKEEEIFYFLTKASIKVIEKFPETTIAEKPLVAVSLCECVVADTGSFFVSSKQLTGRKFFVDNDVHIVIAFTSQVINSVQDGFNFIKTKYDNKLPSMLTLISGPSKTADIEQSLV